LQVGSWQSEVYEEIEKPARERGTVIIAPKHYSTYKRMKQLHFGSRDAFRMVSRIPPDEFEDRLKDYRQLRRNHFLHWEALKIVSTRALPDKEGKKKLQALDLTNPYWVECIRERENWYQDRLRDYRRKGYSMAKAHDLTMADIEKTYAQSTGDSREDKTPWSFLREVYKVESKTKPEPGEFDRLMAITLRNRKLPYKAKQTRKPLPRRPRRIILNG